MLSAEHRNLCDTKVLIFMNIYFEEGSLKKDILVETSLVVKYHL